MMEKRQWCHGSVFGHVVRVFDFSCKVVRVKCNIWR